MRRPQTRSCGARCFAPAGLCANRGQLSANDPVTISPAGSYVPITTPVVETLLSTSFSPEGMVPSESRRLPDPMTRGTTHRRNWSTSLTHMLVPVVHRPATVREAAAVVLSGSARGLHDPVEGHEGAHDQFPHLGVPSIGIPA